MDYATTSDVATFIGTSLGTVNLGNAALALSAASRAVDAFCQRDFETGINTASTMQVEVRSLWRARPDRDFHTTTGLVIAVDNDGDGVAETTIASTGYQLYPLNGFVPGIGTSSYYEIRLTDTTFVQCNVRPVLHVTAKWGWAAVPDVVKRATVMLAAAALQDPTTPFGVAGFDQFGAVRIRVDPRVERMLQPFVRPGNGVLVA